MPRVLIQSARQRALASDREPGASVQGHFRFRRGGEEAGSPVSSGSRDGGGRVRVGSLCQARGPRLPHPAAGHQPWLQVTVSGLIFPTPPRQALREIEDGLSRLGAERMERFPEGSLAVSISGTGANVTASSWGPERAAGSLGGIYIQALSQR